MWYGTGSGSQDTVLHKPPQAAFNELPRRKQRGINFSISVHHSQQAAGN